MFNRVGVNTVHFDLKGISLLGFDCFEVCLGRGNAYMDRLRQVESDMLRADVTHMPMSILEDNLKRLSQHQISYSVLHFPGVYPEHYMEAEVFEVHLKVCLETMNALAQQYHTKILLEYFGSNGMFYTPKQWVECIKPYPHLGLLIDTGHLWFASRLRNFSFEAALEILIPHAEACHLWTGRGEGVYGDNAYYKRYHHILPEFTHKTHQGWAFELAPLLMKLKETEMPIIIEASPTYNGTEHFLDGIQAIKAFMR